MATTISAGSRHGSHSARASGRQSRRSTISPGCWRRWAASRIRRSCAICAASPSSSSAEASSCRHSAESPADPARRCHVACEWLDVRPTPARRALDDQTAAEPKRHVARIPLPVPEEDEIRRSVAAARRVGSNSPDDERRRRRGLSVGEKAVRRPLLNCRRADVYTRLGHRPAREHRAVAGSANWVAALHVGHGSAAIGARSWL